MAHTSWMLLKYSGNDYRLLLAPPQRHTWEGVSYSLRTCHSFLSQVISEFIPLLFIAPHHLHLGFPAPRHLSTIDGRYGSVCLLVIIPVNRLGKMSTCMADRAARMVRSLEMPQRAFTHSPKPVLKPQGDAEFSNRKRSEMQSGVEEGDLSRGALEERACQEGIYRHRVRLCELMEVRISGRTKYSGGAVNFQWIRCR